MTDKQVKDKFRYADGTNEQDNYENFINSFDVDDEVYYRGKHYIKFINEQLKDKEQECEELKKQVKKYGEINEQETKDYAELKAENDLFRTCHDNEQEKRRKYEQTLTEIKEIAENSCCLQPASTCEEYENCKECSRTSDDETVKQIIKKISEVEDERN